MQVAQQPNVRAGHPRYARPPLSKPTPAVERSRLRPEPEGLSLEALRRIVADMIG